MRARSPDARDSVACFFASIRNLVWHSRNRSGHRGQPVCYAAPLWRDEYIFISDAPPPTAPDQGQMN